MNINRIDIGTILNAVNAVKSNNPLTSPVMVGLDDNRFIAYDRTNKSNLVKINKVDLSVLTLNPVDLSNYAGVDFTQPVVSLLDKRFDVSTTFTNGTVNGLVNVIPTSSDESTRLFNLLIWLTGLVSLSIDDVDLSIVDRTLSVAITRSVWFKGTLTAVF